jgi:hypothetical protein
VLLSHRRPWREMAAAAITMDRGALPDAAAVRALLQVTQATHPVPPPLGLEPRLDQSSLHIASPAECRSSDSASKAQMQTASEAACDG